MFQGIYNQIKSLCYSEESFFQAIRDNDFEKVKALCSLKNPTIPFTIKDRRGNTPLLLACGYGSVDMVRYFLERNYAPSAQKTAFDETHYVFAIRNNNKSVLEFLRPRIVTINAFLSAAEAGNLELLESFFIHDPTFLQRTDLYGTTPLMAAAKSGSLPVVEFIFSLNPESLNVIKTEMEYEQYSTWIRQGRISPVKCNALDFADIKSYVPIMKFLLEKGAQIHDHKSDYLKLAHKMFDHAKFGGLEEIRKWRNQGNSLCFTESEHGNTLLHIALSYKQTEVALYLIEEGISRKSLNIQKETPFQLAIKTQGLKYVFSFYLLMTEKLSAPYVDDVFYSFKIHELYCELDKLVAFAVEKGIEVDYEYLALNFDKKYWSHYAKELYQLKKTDTNPLDYATKKEKLFAIIYSGQVICRENTGLEESKEELETKDKSENPGSKISKETKESKEKKDSLEFIPSDRDPLDFQYVESQEARFIRLKWSLKVALETGDFKSAMRVLIESTSKEATLSDVVLSSEKCTDCQSKDDFILRFMELQFKDRSQEKSKEKPYLGL